MSGLFLNILDIHPEFSILFDKHQEIRDEIFSNWSKIQVKDFTVQQEESIRVKKEGFPVTTPSLFDAPDSDLKSRGWHLAVISQHNLINPYNQKILPKLSSLVLSFGHKITASAINFLSPNASLDWHRDDGYSDFDEIRNMWVIDAPEEEGRSSIFEMRGDNGYPFESKIVKNNELYSFKHSTWHRVENNLSKFRTVLIFDVIT